MSRTSKANAYSSKDFHKMQVQRSGPKNTCINQCCHANAGAGAIQIGRIIEQ